MTLYGELDGVRGSLEERVLKISAPKKSVMGESNYLVPKLKQVVSI